MPEKMKVYALNAMAMMWAFLAPIHTLIMATGALVLFDLVTGIAKAVKAKEKVTSNRMRHTVTKGMMYQIAILAAYMLDVVIGMEQVAARVVAGVICMVECKSVLENVNVMTGINMWESVLNALKPPKVNTQPKDEEKDEES
jgi:phage-related holin